MFKVIFALFITLLSNFADAASAPWVGATLNGLPCSGGGQGYGPFDYTQRARLKENINLVESAHFTPDVENLIKGNAGSLEGDLDYTLRAWPNHHKALLSIIRYQLRINKKQMPGKLATPPECYLQRAIRFSPSDVGSYSLYAYYLKEVGIKDKAANIYQKALAMSADNAKLEYSYSLFLIEEKQYDKALEYAKKAYSHAKPPLGLKNKLIKLGVWK